MSDCLLIGQEIVYKVRGQKYLARFFLDLPKCCGSRIKSNSGNIFQLSIVADGTFPHNDWGIMSVVSTTYEIGEKLVTYICHYANLFNLVYGVFSKGTLTAVQRLPKTIPVGGRGVTVFGYLLVTIELSKLA